MSGLAVFSLKYASLLEFEKEKLSAPLVRKNLHSLYGIEHAPCDTYLRERLDDGSFVGKMRPIFSGLLKRLQRSKVLEGWKFLNQGYLISLDASGFFSSHEVHCDHCCQKVRDKGTEKEQILYHHQMLVGSIVSPHAKQVFPVNFEPMVKADGQKKNDCERSAAKRWLHSFREQHPQLPTIIVADGLYSNAPFITMVQEKRCSFIIVAKEEDHKYLYEYFWAGSGEDIGEGSCSYTKNKRHYQGTYRFISRSR